VKYLDSNSYVIAEFIDPPINKLVDVLNYRYNTMHFERYVHKDGQDCIAIGDFTVCVLDVFALNNTAEQLIKRVIAFCDNNINLIKNIHKKENIKILKSEIKFEITCSFDI